jgi:hypothetical protein
MRSRDRLTTYKGLAILVRWVELDRGDSWGPGTHRFTASYLVAAPGPAFGVWHCLRQDVFDSYRAASAHALAAAQRAIDTNIGTDVRAGVTDRTEARQELAEQA